MVTHSLLCRMVASPILEGASTGQMSADIRGAGGSRPRQQPRGGCVWGENVEPGGSGSPFVSPHRHLVNSVAEGWRYKAYGGCLPGERLNRYCRAIPD